MKKCIGSDGETYYEINGNWYVVLNGKIRKCSKPERFVKCTPMDDNDKKFWYKHLLKE